MTSTKHCEWIFSLTSHLKTAKGTLHKLRRMSCALCMCTAMIPLEWQPCNDWAISSLFGNHNHGSRPPGSSAPSKHSLLPPYKKQLCLNLPSETDSGVEDNARQVTVPEIVAECVGSQLSIRSTSLESMVRVNSHGVCFALSSNGSYVPTIFSVKRIPGFFSTKLVLSVNNKRCHVCLAHTTFSSHFNKTLERFCF